MGESTGEVVVGGCTVGEQDDGSASIERLDVGSWREREVIVVNVGGWGFRGLEVFAFLVQMSFCRSNAWWEVLGEGEFVNAWPGDKIPVFYCFGPGGGGRAAAAAM